MDLILRRTSYGTESTLGTLSEVWQDVPRFLCYTLEDTVRGPGIKIPGKTAIPMGKYELVIDESTRFKKLMPHILNVPMFSGIRIHSGNTPENTEGCILVGLTKSDNFIGKSRDAFSIVFNRIQEALKTEKVFITIS